MLGPKRKAVPDTHCQRSKHFHPKSSIDLSFWMEKERCGVAGGRWHAFEIEGIRRHRHYSPLRLEALIVSKMRNTKQNLASWILTTQCLHSEVDCNHAIFCVCNWLLVHRATINRYLLFELSTKRFYYSVRLDRNYFITPFVFLLCP